MKTLSLLLAVGALSAFTPSAQAETYCDENTLGRTVVGAGLGAIVGNIIGDGDDGATALGAVFGGAVGLGMSCESYPTYYRERNYVLDREIYSNYHEWDNGRIRVIRSGYYGGMVCREYESFMAVEDEYGDMDEVVVTEVACRYPHGWRVVHYPVSSFRWGNNYSTLSIHYIPSSRYSWGYSRYYGGSYRGRHYGPASRDFFFGRRNRVSDHHRWGHRRHDRFDRRNDRPDFGRPRRDRQESPRGGGFERPRGGGDRGGDHGRGGSRGEGRGGNRGEQRGPRR